MKPHSEIENTADLARLFAAIEKVNHRLDKLEGKDVDMVRLQSNHPSLDKLAIAEAIADSLFEKEKACSFEPSKPCDHCSMCNSRGF